MEQLKGKYLLERPLGRGGMAEVFLGRTLGAAGFSHPVAIKRILAGFRADARFRAMFIAEARLSARLSHGNVVSVLDFDEDEAGRLFLVMELVDGTDLAGLLGAGLLPLPVALFVTKEILRGLGHAHELPISDDGVRGLVHRDVSPHNVLIAWDGAVKVSDFGIAKARAATNASASIFLKGKAAYMSPEQANGAVLDGRSDLFAVGVILWEMLCGASLFGRDSLQASLKAVLFDPIPSPRARRPDVPAEVERVALKLLAQDREDRYRDAGAAIAALDACAAFPRDGRALLSGLLVERRRAGALRRGDGAATPLERPAPAVDAPGAPGADPEETATAPPPSAPWPDPAEPSLLAAPRRPRSRRLVPLALLGLATALTVGLAVGLAAHRSGGDASVPPASRAAPLPAAPAPRQPPRESPAALARDTPAPAPPGGPPDPASTSRVPRAPAGTPQPQERKARPAPPRGATSRDGIRVIDLRGSPPSSSATAE